MEIVRKTTKRVNIGGVFVGGGAPLSIQSMTNTKTINTSLTVSQINALSEAGCDIVRVSVPDAESARAVKEIKNRIKIPLVCDVHFDYRLAIESVKNGADKLRINPGNIGGSDKIKAVAKACKDFSIPIRVGVNSGSLEKDILLKHNGATPYALVESALRNVEILEDCNFFDIVVSIKSSNVYATIKAYELFTEKSDYPLHIGVTEAGTIRAGSIKSAVGIGALLSKGIGDTLRVSLTGDPIEEIICAKEILKSLGYKGYGPTIISCPTCARTEIDIISLANDIENRLKNVKKDIKVAVMGCAVNGPNEAKDADIGIAGGKGTGIIFKDGGVIGKYNENDIVDALMNEVDKYVCGCIKNE